METEETRNILMTKIKEVIEVYETITDCVIGCEITFIDPNIPVNADTDNEINYSYNGDSFVKCDVVK